MSYLHIERFINSIAENLLIMSQIRQNRGLPKLGSTYNICGKILDSYRPKNVPVCRKNPPTLQKISKCLTDKWKLNKCFQMPKLNTRPPRSESPGVIIKQDLPRFSEVSASLSPKKLSTISVRESISKDYCGSLQFNEPVPDLQATTSPTRITFTSPKNSISSDIHQCNSYQKSLTNLNKVLQDHMPVKSVMNNDRSLTNERKEINTEENSEPKERKKSITSSALSKERKKTTTPSLPSKDIEKESTRTPSIPSKEKRRTRTPSPLSKERRKRTSTPNLLSKGNKRTSTPSSVSKERKRTRTPSPLSKDRKRTRTPSPLSRNRKSHLSRRNQKRTSTNFTSENNQERSQSNSPIFLIPRSCPILQENSNMNVCDTSHSHCCQLENNRLEYNTKCYNPHSCRRYFNQSGSRNYNPDYSTRYYNTKENNTRCYNVSDYNTNCYNSSHYNTNCYNTEDYNTRCHNNRDYNTKCYNTRNYNTNCCNQNSCNYYLNQTNCRRGGGGVSKLSLNGEDSDLEKIDFPNINQKSSGRKLYTTPQTSTENTSNYLFNHNRGRSSRGSFRSILQNQSSANLNKEENPDRIRKSRSCHRQQSLADIYAEAAIIEQGHSENLQEGYPACLTSIKPIGTSTLHLNWELKDNNKDIAGYLIFLDGNLVLTRNSSQLHTALIPCVNAIKPHKVTLMPIEHESHYSLKRCFKNDHWVPSVHLYSPKMF